MPTEAQKSRLNPEQLAIAEKWEHEKTVLDGLYKELGAAQRSGDHDTFMEVLDRIENVTPDFCEHERSVWSNCHACDEIEKCLNPEFYDEEGVRFSYEEIEKIIDERG